jgi:hypothetical protein
LEGLGRSAEADAAFQRAFQRADLETPSARIRIHCVYGYAVAARLPEQARAAFENVLRDEPNHVQALYGLAMLASTNEPLEAITYLDRALDADARFADALRQRALLCARRRDFAKATRDINLCLQLEPRSGPTLYTAACVQARGANGDANAINKALDFLEHAFLRGYGRDRAANDEDLTALRKNPRFRQLLESDN